MPTPPDAAWLLFWAKTNRDAEDGLPTRPLWAHLIDVAHAALLLWEQVLPLHLKRRTAQDLRMPVDETGYVLAFWIGLHDIGKAIPTFQALHRPSQEALESAGFRFRGYTERKHHGHASIAILATWLCSSTSAPFLEQVAAWVGAHHGRLYPRREWEKDASNPAILGDALWREARHRLLQAVETVWFDHYPVEHEPDPPRRTSPAWLPAFGGWATLADWLGSMAFCYPHQVVEDRSDYVAHSRRGAEAALKASGFGQGASLTDPGFEKLFPFRPNPMQQALIDLPLPLNDTPTLVIVEGPTGEGKTEGAFARVAHQQAHTEGNGLYVAMPTQATSNGLFPRTLDFLRKAHRGPVNFRLVHGNAELHPEQEMLISDVADLETLFDADDAGASEVEGVVRTLRWFLPRKRSLLAPYGLGTVDQAFLGILYARHFFLRLFALTGKTVIFDEVHAYDLYMQHLFTRLLRWLHALGAHVILLSATLPSHMRTACFHAWGGAAWTGTVPPEEVPYPAVWLAQSGCATLEASGFATRWKQQANLLRHDPDPVRIAEATATAYHAGAVVLVICNTVRRAQQVYQALPEALRDEREDVMLLHARYRFGVRQQKEEAALERFGKNRPNGQGAILIATQLAEQSLDLDADVLFTDLAPIDLLLQRAGRLHRHLEARPSAERPQGYQEPTVYWLCPEAEPGHLPDLSNIGIRTSRFTVYLPTIAWRTWSVLRHRASWSLPNDYRPLIEAVYAEGRAQPEGLTEVGDGAWSKAEQLFDKLEAEARGEAMRQLIPEPTSIGLRKLLDPDRRTLADADDDDAHPSQRVLTRLGADSVDVVLLFADEEGALHLNPDGARPAPLDVPPGRADLPTKAVRVLLQNAVRISYEDIARELAERDEASLPAAWRRAAVHTAALQQRHPLVLTDRSAVIAGYCIKDDEELGVCIDRVK